MALLCQRYRVVRDRSAKFWLRAKNFVEDEHGQDMVEYALLAGFVAVAGSVLFPEIARALVHVLGAHLG
jgi:hypothetical protein